MGLGSCLDFVFGEIEYPSLSLLQVVEVAPSELEDLALYSKYSVKDNNNKNTGLQTREA